MKYGPGKHAIDLAPGVYRVRLVPGRVRIRTSHGWATSLDAKGEGWLTVLPGSYPEIEFIAGEVQLTRE